MKGTLIDFDERVSSSYLAERHTKKGENLYLPYRALTPWEALCKSWWGPSKNRGA